MMNIPSAGDPCDPNPCLHDGTCVDLPAGQYMCHCKSGWEGKTCDGKPREGPSSLFHCAIFSLL